MSNFEPSSVMQDPEFVSVYDELALWAAPFGLKLLDAIKYRRTITALDIGFGTGFPLLELAMRLGQTSRIYGIDPWSAAADRARTKIVRFAINNVQLIEGNAEAMPLPDNSIDLIVSNNGLNNVDDLAKAFAECSRVSKSGAQFLATMNLDSTMVEFYLVMDAVLRTNGLLNEIDAMKAHIRLKRRPLAEVTDLAEKCGFRIVRITQDKFAYHFATGTAMLNHQFIRLWFLSAWKSIVPAEHQKLVFGQIEDKLNALAETNGTLTLSVPFALIECEKI
jgi:arsenite methyltransferase